MPGVADRYNESTTMTYYKETVILYMNKQVTPVVHVNTGEVQCSGRDFINVFIKRKRHVVMNIIRILLINLCQKQGHFLWVTAIFISPHTCFLIKNEVLVWCPLRPVKYCNRTADLCTFLAPSHKSFWLSFSSISKTKISLHYKKI